MEGSSSTWSVTSIISLSASGGLGSVAREGVGAEDIAREALRGKKDRASAPSWPRSQSARYLGSVCNGQIAGQTTHRIAGMK